MGALYKGLIVAGVLSAVADRRSSISELVGFSGTLTMIGERQR